MAQKRHKGIGKAVERLTKEEVESLDEGKMDKMTLSGLWHKHAQHSYWNDQGYGSGTDSPRHSGHAATAIENHVRKHHGNKVADDMVSHSDHHVAYHEYAGPEESPHHEKEMAKLKKKHGISDKDLHESAPPGFEGTVKAMKKHKDIDNPWALAWSMKNKGYKSHKKADGSAKNEEVEVPTQKTLRWFKENAFDYKSPRKPEPNGGSGVKQGSRYGGTGHRRKKVNEAKGPISQEDGPFVSSINDTHDLKPLNHARYLAKKSLDRVQKEMMNK
jgi:hypothetical protein